MALANNWLRNGHMNTSRPMISEENLLRTSEDGFLVFKTKGQKGMVFSSGIVLCSVEAKNCEAQDEAKGRTKRITRKYSQCS